MPLLLVTPLISFAFVLVAHPHIVTGLLKKRKKAKSHSPESAATKSNDDSTTTPSKATNEVVELAVTAPIATAPSVTAAEIGA